MNKKGDMNDLIAYVLEVAAKLDRDMPDLIAVAVMGEAAASHKQRIFDNGLKTDGTPIGPYSSTPTYYPKKAFVRTTAFVPQGKGKDGKPARGKKKNGDTRKTMFLPGGYRELREVQARDGKNKNYKYSGSLERGLNVVKNSIYVGYGTTDADESDKMNWLEDATPGVFGLSNTEREIIKEGITEQAVITAKKA